MIAQKVSFDMLINRKSLSLSYEFARKISFENRTENTVKKGKIRNFFAVFCIFEQKFEFCMDRDGLSGTVKGRRLEAC